MERCFFFGKIDSGKHDIIFKCFCVIPTGRNFTFFQMEMLVKIFFDGWGQFFRECRFPE